MSKNTFGENTRQQVFILYCKMEKLSESIFFYFFSFCQTLIHFQASQWLIVEKHFKVLNI